MLNNLKVIKTHTPLIKIIFLIGIFVLPLIFWPTAQIPYEIPKVWFVRRWVEILGIIALLVGIKTLKKEKPDSKLIILINLFLISATISSIFGVDFIKSLWGNYYRQDGLLTIYHLAALSFLINLFWNKNWQKHTALAISLGSICTSIWVIYDGYKIFISRGLSLISVNNAVGATFGQPNFLAGYLLVTLPFSVYFLLTKRNNKLKLLWTFLILLQLTALFLSRSWAGMFGVVILVLGTLQIIKKKLKFSYILIFLLATTLITLAYINQKTISKIPNHYIAESRERIYTKAILAFTNKPILGCQ
jgi:hypothetical protein